MQTRAAALSGLRRYADARMSRAPPRRRRALALMLTLTLATLGRYAEARELYERCLEIHPWASGAVLGVEKAQRALDAGRFGTPRRAGSASGGAMRRRGLSRRPGGGGGTIRRRGMHVLTRRDAP